MIVITGHNNKQQAGRRARVQDNRIDNRLQDQQDTGYRIQDTGYTCKDRTTTIKVGNKYPVCKSSN